MIALSLIESSLLAGGVFDEPAKVLIPWAGDKAAAATETERLTENNGWTGAWVPPFF
jgi:hypothetical protein